VSVFQESGIEFDFTAASSAEKFDSASRVFPSVDFLVTDTYGQLWVEVKSWRVSRFPPRNRGGQRRAFLAKLRLGKDAPFPRELREKFLGTCTQLTLTGTPPTTDICYIVVLESDRPLDSQLRTHLMDRLRQQLRTSARQNPWVFPISVAVVNTAEWNQQLSFYPARLL
jgi:hypothetical protein